MKLKKILPFAMIVGFCYFYTGSAYMSQFYRLMDYFDDQTVDLITSCYFYLLQAAGVGAFSFLLWKKPALVYDKKLFTLLLVLGGIFMSAAQLVTSPLLIVLFSFAFHLCVGFYFGFYLTLFALHVPAKHSGLCFGFAYAAGSVGTYLLSLIGDGTFLISKEITGLYLLSLAITVAFVFLSPYEPLEAQPRKLPPRVPFLYILVVLSLMCVISVIGSGLYYSLPAASHINWNLIRAFYAFGLVLAGFLMDRKRLIGEICVVASLTYPLIAASLIGNGVTGTVAMALSYAFRGFLTIYYVTAFSDYAAKDSSLAYLAPVGLMLSRLIEALLTLLLIQTSISPIVQLIFSAACFIPLLIIFVLMQNLRYPARPLTREMQLIRFAEAAHLTGRETEVLQCLMEGMSDGEIAEKCFISKNTVRFHISNIMKKTKNTSRLEVVRAVQKTE